MPDFYEQYTMPDDPDIVALLAAIVAHPGEDTPQLMLIDRLRELNRHALATFYELSLNWRRIHRDFYHELLVRFAIPKSAFSLDSVQDSVPSGVYQVEGQKPE